jgi:hypothetical protein
MGNDPIENNKNQIFPHFHPIFAKLFAIARGL